MNIRSIFGLAVAGLLCLSCQSGSYQIEGFALACAEGDTICLADETAPGSPFDASLVVNGKFQFAGETSPDTIRLCRAFVKERPECMTVFFLEPGHLTVELATEPARCRVSGTRVNNEWQQLNDSIRLLSAQLFHELDHLSGTSANTHHARFLAVDSLHRRMSDCILYAARRNSDNILGRYIYENYKAPEFK